MLSCVTLQYAVRAECSPAMSQPCCSSASPRRCTPGDAAGGVGSAPSACKVHTCRVAAGLQCHARPAWAVEARGQHPDEEDGPHRAQALPQACVLGGVQQHDGRARGLDAPQLLQEGQEGLLRAAHNDVPAQLCHPGGVLDTRPLSGCRRDDVCTWVNQTGVDVHMQLRRKATGSCIDAGQPEP